MRAGKEFLLKTRYEGIVGKSRKSANSLFENYMAFGMDNLNLDEKEYLKMLLAGHLIAKNPRFERINEGLDKKFATRRGVVNALSVYSEKYVEKAYEVGKKLKEGAEKMVQFVVNRKGGSEEEKRRMVMRFEMLSGVANMVTSICAEELKDTLVDYGEIKGSRDEMLRLKIRRYLDEAAVDLKQA